MDLTYDTVTEDPLKISELPIERLETVMFYTTEELDKQLFQFWTQIIRAKDSGKLTEELIDDIHEEFESNIGKLLDST